MLFTLVLLTMNPLLVGMISTALRTGAPLPQVTPCPLTDRFLSAMPGFHIQHRDDEEDFGLPRKVTAETLEDEQYLYGCLSFLSSSHSSYDVADVICRFYSVGAATAWGIVLRLDRLMVATKELVGEQFHIHGLPLYNTKSRASR